MFSLKSHQIPVPLNRRISSTRAPPREHGRLLQTCPHIKNGKNSQFHLKTPKSLHLTKISPNGLPSSARHPGRPNHPDRRVLPSKWQKFTILTILVQKILLFSNFGPDSAVFCSTLHTSGGFSMPNYEYECRKCEYQWADIRTIAERDTPTTLPCPQCHALEVARGWNHAPTMGVDGSLKPSKGFTERMEGIRSKLGKYNPQVRANIDRALDHRGGRYGPQ